MEAGIIVQQEETEEIIYRQGTLKLDGEKLVGGYAEVFRKDRGHSFRIEVAFDEYAGRKKDGSLNSQWSRKGGGGSLKLRLCRLSARHFQRRLQECTWQRKLERLILIIQREISLSHRHRGQ